LHQLDTFYNALNVNDQDSLNSAAGGNFLDKMPSDCLKIIESKSKVRQSQAKQSLPRALLLDKKNQSSAQATSPTPAPIKAVESNCVTCGGTHSYQNCPATSGNVYQDNINEPPGFPTVQNNQNNFNRGNNFTQNRGALRNIQSQGQSTQTQCQNIQNHYQTVQNQLANLTDMMSKFMSSNMASSSGSGTLSGNTVTNPKEDLKGITTRSGVAYQGPTIPTPSKVVKQADLGASINLMPLSVWKELSLPELTPTYMTLDLVDRSVSKPIGIAKDVKTGRTLNDVHKGELTLRIENEAITYNLDQTSRYSANYDQMTKNKIDVTDEACEEYFQEVLGFSNVTASGSPSPSDDPIVSTTSPTLTPFGYSDFLLFEEANAFLGLEDDPDSPELDPSYYDPEGDIQMLEAILNSDPAPSLLDHEQSVTSFTNELKACEAKTIKSFVDEPLEV
nr:reverse transcriptase domain-containing protein [Tanacetum cinerariifolium]